MDCPCVGVRDSRYDNSCESQCKDSVYIVDAAEKWFIVACTFRSSLKYLTTKISAQITHRTKWKHGGPPTSSSRSSNWIPTTRRVTVNLPMQSKNESN